MTDIQDACNIAQFIKPVTSFRVLLSWFREFHDNGRMFVFHSILNDIESEEKLPQFLELHPELKDAIVEYSLENLETCSVTMMNKFINKCIYIIVEKEKDFYDLSQADIPPKEDDNGAPKEENPPDDILCLEDGFVIQGYNLRDELFKLMMGVFAQKR